MIEHTLHLTLTWNRFSKHISGFSVSQHYEIGIIVRSMLQVRRPRHGLARG